MMMFALLFYQTMFNYSKMDEKMCDLIMQLQLTAGRWQTTKPKQNYFINLCPTIFCSTTFRNCSQSACY